MSDHTKVAIIHSIQSDRQIGFVMCVVCCVSHHTFSETPPSFCAQPIMTTVRKQISICSEPA